MQATLITVTVGELAGCPDPVLVSWGQELLASGTNPETVLGTVGMGERLVVAVADAYAEAPHAARLRALLNTGYEALLTLVSGALDLDALPDGF